MLHLGEHNVVSGFEVGGAPGLGDEINPFGCTPRENDFVGTARVDELSGPRTRCFECGGSPIAQFMYSPMYVGIVMAIIPV